jgi:SWI/SNF-related matrix-associated actin-dependent regulator of chromatin subfamily A member 5
MDRPFDAMITTYETMSSHIGWLKSKAWRLVVLDEGHHIKNENTMAANAACSLTACQRIILTGTPLQNDLSELWSLLRFILPDIFHYEHSKELFAKAYNRSTFYRDEEFVEV